MNWRWPFQKRALTAADLPDSLVSAPTPAGIPVTAATALHSPTVLGCVRLLSEIVGTLPVHVYRKADDGSRDRADHAAATVLSRPNPWTGSSEFRTRLMVDALLCGEAFAKVVRVGGKPRELHRLDPSGVTVKIDDRTLEPSYHVAQKTGAPIILGWRDVLHIQTPGSLPDRPLKLLDAARDAISIDLAMARYQGRVFGGGARPSGLLKVPAKTPTERRKEIKEAWDEAHSGGQAGRTALIDDTMSWEAISLSLVESDFLNLRKHAASEINRAFKVPETLNGNLDRGVWKNVEELTQVFLDFALTPWLDAWQNAYERVLLKESERGQYFVEFKIDAIAKANLQSRYAAYRQATGGSWMTPDEIRKLDNLPPIEGGSKLLLQAGQTPADQPSTPAQEQNDRQD